MARMVRGDGIQKVTQSQFGGYDHRRGAGDGTIWDEKNMAADQYPLLTTRGKRYTVRTLMGNPNGIFGADELVIVEGTQVYYGDTPVGTVTDGKKIIVGIGKRVVIFPDRKYFDETEKALKSLESQWSGAATFQDGTIYEEEAAANTITASGVSWADYFAVGDGVTISGCTGHPENNKTAIVREIAGNELRFYENVFTLGEGTSYTENAVTLKRSVPELDWYCVNENRVWGGKGDEIWCSKLGDPTNWNVFDGVGTDAWEVQAGTARDMTGCVSFLGYPVFFKEGNIFKVYGDLPSNFQTMASATMGIMAGSGRSPAVAGETLFYLSRNGVCAYSGGIPRVISSAFGERKYRNGVGGSSGEKYYLSCVGEEGNVLFVYDTRSGLWTKQDDIRAVGFAYTDNFYCLTEDKQLLILEGRNIPTGAAVEQDMPWAAEWIEETMGTLNRKSLKKLQLRCELEGTGEVYVRYDDGAYQKIGELTGGKKQEEFYPAYENRCDRVQIKLTGTGRMALYGLAKEYAEGSER